MVRVANSIKLTVMMANDYIIKQINLTDRKIQESEGLIKKLQDEGVFTTANITSYKNKLIQDAKDAKKKQIKMERWLLNYLGITTIPTAYTDAQVDTENPAIRTHEG